jgi:uncharacterized cofD-like protein
MGSLLLAELTHITSSVECALEEVRHILKVSGEAIPASPLSMEQDGVQDFDIAAAAPGVKKPSVYAEAKASPRAIQAIVESDAIILGPGSLHDEVLPCLGEAGLAEAIASSDAIRIYVCGLVTSRSEEDCATASGFLRQLINCLGPDSLDWVVLNNAPLETSVLEEYSRMGEKAVIPDVVEVGQIIPGVISAPLADEGLPVRYNPGQTAKAIFQAMLVGRMRQGVCRDSTPAVSAEPLAHGTSL